MDGRESVARTPLNNVLVQRRSGNRSNRTSYRSCVTAVSHLALTPGLSSWRHIATRRSSRSRCVTEKVDPKQLALLVKKEWQLSYVTPLYRFGYAQLKDYSRKLSAFIAAEKQKGLVVELGAETSFNVSFSVVLGLTETKDDAKTIFIQIHSKPMYMVKDEAQKLLWTGWLTCVNANPDYLHSLPKDFTCLPVCCSRGAEWLDSLVRSWFQVTFDCCFGALEINSTNLQWLAALWTNCHSVSNIQHLSMVWTLPVTPPLKVNYKINPHDAWELWRSVREQPQEQENDRGGSGRAEEEEVSVTIEEVTRFMAGLKNHFYRHFRMDLSAGNLDQVSTALGSAKHNGSIKISNSSYLITTLMLLTESALLKMPL
ncbi:centromere protein L [Lampris incognitus]|uniref:centromere protein L n=1 Tax=Lampris incognitus TaxID=2546036 RepID=UPI0024B590B1|nr:centromere protein L [Lampris incognitus]